MPQQDRFILSPVMQPLNLSVVVILMVLVPVLVHVFLMPRIGSQKRTMEVTATAYNNVAWQTSSGHTAITAWGDTLKPGLKAIAVSRDLIGEGLDHRTKVQINGVPGTFRVLDKMNRRWEKRIDIFMEKDLAVAREWGKKQVTITWWQQKK